jgi:predicted negative regulator of RcsB-dependent stress response
VSTTKLTRKEILAEDPVHEAMIRIIEFFRERGKIVALGVLTVALLGVGIYFGLEYLDSRDMAAQQQLSKAMDFFHARVDPSALDDPYGKGPTPYFRTEDAKLQASIKEFSTLISKYGSSKLGIIGRYYLGLCQLRAGQKNEGVQSLEAVRNNSKDRTLSYLAKKVLAKHYLDSGNLKGAKEILNGMIQDPQCELPREELKLDLARIYEAEGKRDEAIKLLKQTREEAGRSTLQGLLVSELNRMEGFGAAKAQNPKSGPITIRQSAQAPK